MIIHNGIRLRRVCEKDISALSEILSSEDINHFAQRLPRKEGIDISAYLQRELSPHLQNSRPPLHFILDSGDEIIGEIEIFDIVQKENLRLAEIGFWLAKEYRGYGIMSGAIERLSDYAKDIIGIDYLCAKVLSGNDSCMKILMNCGFAYMRSYEDYKLFEKGLVVIHNQLPAMNMGY